MYEANRTMRLAALALVALAAGGGCFKPKVKNRSFVCDAATPACPQGFVCRAGFCDDGSGGPLPVTGDDMSMPGTGGNGSDVDMSMTAGGDMSLPPGADMSMPPDMAKAADMAKPADLAKQCKVFPATCTQDSECCDNTCWIDGKCFT